MLRTLLILLTALGLLAAESEPRTRTGKLTKVEADRAVCDIAQVPVGVSGIVVHRYDRQHAAIVASVTVSASDPSQTTLRLLPYKGLVQPNLPTVKTPPQVGDTVILGYLYDRVLPIVPNQKTFDLAKARFKNLHIIHPDLVAAELAKEKTPLPNRAVLQRTCEKFDLGIVMITFQDGTDFLDCISWTKLAESNLTSVDANHFKQPFYHRFGTLPSPFYQWGEQKIGNFDRYYRRLEKKE